MILLISSTLLNVLKLIKLISELFLLSNADICKTNPTPTSPFYELVEESDRMCTTWCRDTNQKYVEFLNKNIYKIKNTLFIDTRFFIIVLNPIDADTGNCVHNKPGKTFNCICNANYQIMVNRTLYVTFLHIVNGALEQDKHTIKREDFSALMILLKFYPRSAVFYLAYLFQKYDVPPKLSTFAPSRRLIINFGDGLVPEDVDGKVEERRQFKEYGNKIYMKVLNLIARGECISNISNDYFNKNNDIEFRDLLITLVTIFKETRDYVQGKY